MSFVLLVPARLKSQLVQGPWVLRDGKQALDTQGVFFCLP